jgi:hypothetical protein
LFFVLGFFRNNFLHQQKLKQKSGKIMKNWQNGCEIDKCNDSRVI